MQDFRRLYEVQRIVQACLPDDERGQVVLPGWMRAYAAAAWQDRFFAEQNFTPLQQVRPSKSWPVTSMEFVNDYWCCHRVVECRGFSLSVPGAPGRHASHGPAVALLPIS